MKHSMTGKEILDFDSYAFLIWPYFSLLFEVNFRRA